MIFLSSFMITLGALYVGNLAIKEHTYKRMLQYSIETTREDGASNRVIMNGVSGFVGRTNVGISYMNGGKIRLNGANYDEIDGWQRISEFTLEPGRYTFTGMKGQGENTIALQLDIMGESGIKYSYYQFNDDVYFLTEKPTDVALYIRVFPAIGKVDVIARPAVYKDE